MAEIKTEEYTELDRLVLSAHPMGESILLALDPKEIAFATQQEIERFGNPRTGIDASVIRELREREGSPFADLQHCIVHYRCSDGKIYSLIWQEPGAIPIGHSYKNGGMASLPFLQKLVDVYRNAPFDKSPRFALTQNDYEVAQPLLSALEMRGYRVHHIK